MVISVKVSKPGFCLVLKVTLGKLLGTGSSSSFLLLPSVTVAQGLGFREITRSLCTRDGRLPMLKLEISLSRDVMEE